MSLTELAQLGQFMAGLALLITSICAAATLIRITLQQQRKHWFDDFRTLFTEFWNNKDVSEARRWIASEKLYNEVLKPVMRKLIENEQNELDEKESIIQDKLDKFIALFIQIEALGKMVAKKHHGIFGEISLFSKYWRGKIRSYPELTEYISKDWADAITII